MFRIYGSYLCRDCVVCKYNFDKYGVAYEFIDITKNIHDLAAFLELRDQDKVFDHCKEIGDVGLPALIREDGSVFLSWEKYLEEKGCVIQQPEEAPQACSLDRKGC